MSAATTPATDLDRLRFFVDGDWVAPRGSAVQQVREAATGEPLGTAALGTAADIDGAVRAARRALDGGPWGRSTPAERAEAMRRLAAALKSRGKAASTLVSRENGMPIGLSGAVNGAAPAVLLRTYADQAETLAWEEPRRSRSGTTIVRREPVGVVGAITPWNYPLLLAMWKIAPALAAGCTVVLKHAPETALDAYLLADAAQEAALPAGVLNIVLGDREAGAALVSHPDVDKIAFTGSTAAGRVIGAECGRLIRRCTLELGGKSAAIVCDDADLDAVRAQLGATSLLNNGQTCTSHGRILAPRSRYAEVVDAVATFAAEQVVGDPLDPAVTIGPMAAEHHRERVLGHIDRATAGDARLVVGGGTPADRPRGWFVEPTVFADVSPDAPLAREEVFGPVLAVLPYDGDDEAVALANDSEYGLAGTVFTADEERGLALARRIRSGTVGVNRYEIDMGAPFGGMKASGVGRELGPEALDAYLEYKSIYVSAGRP